MDNAKMDLEMEVEQLDTDFAEVEKELKQPTPDKNQLLVHQRYLKTRMESYNKVLTTYMNYLRTGNPTEFKIQYQNDKKIAKRKAEIDLKLDAVLEKKSSSPPPEPYHLNLPRRELPKFNGDVRKWQAYWASFEKIHEDPTIPEIEKLNYLLQSTVPDSSARQVVASFPAAAGNYEKAITQLKERFGRPSMLIKEYVRDLLKLVIDNAQGKSVDFVTLVTTISSQIRNLETLGVTKDQSEQILYPVVESCLPNDVLQAWQRHSAHTEKLDKFIEFLESEVNNQTERTLAQTQFKAQPENTKEKKNEKSSSSTSTRGNAKKKSDTPTAAPLSASSSKQKKKCLFCKKDSHPSKACPVASEMVPDVRKATVISLGHCPSCLFKGHSEDKCNIKLKCLICKDRHETIMCSLMLPSDPRKPGAGDWVPKNLFPDYDQKEEKPGTSNVHSLANQVRSPEVPLQIVVVKAYGVNGKSVVVRAVMDTGSQRSYITAALAKQLQLPFMGEENIVNDLFGGKQSQEVTTPVTKVYLTALDGSNRTTFNASNVDVIIRAAQPMTSGYWVSDFIRKGVTFDDLRSTTSRIDLLIGDDVAARIYTGKICHLPYGPSAMETLFGWAPCGKLPIKPTSAGALLISSLMSKDRPISDLWALDTLGINDLAEKESRKELEENATRHFRETVTRDSEGRYEVELPFLSNFQTLLPTNYAVAEKRLRTTTAKLKKDNYFEQYDLLFKQWEENKMIETCDSFTPTTALNSPGSSIGAFRAGSSTGPSEGCRLKAGGAPWDKSHTSCGNGVHYLPHRAVVKASSLTTPIRPVFDASAKSKGIPSLNDCLERGPNLLELIPAILTRFRLYQHAAVSDIKKAFQQISVKEKHRDFLRFLWWEDDSCKRIKIYRHTRVVFGVSSSPFLLGVTLQHHLQNSPPSLQWVAEKILDNIYVDNCVVSFPTKEKVMEFHRLSQELLLPAQFDLRGWEFGPKTGEHVTESVIVPVLGLTWNSREDILSLELSSVMEKIESPITKRSVLSICHSVFDPLGVSAPFMLQGKLILQQAHKLALGWDVNFPEELQADFVKWRKQLPLLSNFNVPRFLDFNENKSSIHIFCDASQSAYAAVAFVRVRGKQNGKGKVQSHFLMAKSRVAPPGKITISRLELIGCLIAARLGSTILEYFQNPNLAITYWCDSTTALAWIKGEGPWGVFVSNRVMEIRKLTCNGRDGTSIWRHVPGEVNPADVASRGCSAKKLLESNWWQGPSWLLHDPSSWPSVAEKVDCLAVEAERKKTVTTLIVNNNDKFLSEFTKFSSFIKATRAMAYVGRFVNSFVNKVRPEKNFPPAPPTLKLSANEIRSAEATFFKKLQQELQDSPKLKQLKPVLDDQGILRHQSRLTHDDAYEFLQPIILPGDNEFVEMMIMEEHVQNSHAGVQFVLGSLRRRFWILNGRRSVRKVLKKCSTCRRYQAQRLNVQQAPLPEMRTGDLVPFATTGVDMAGPLFLSDGRKVWIALFTCGVYRAVHMELTDTLSTDGFFNCLRRFIARRGRPQTIYSDNGLNFTGASRILQRVNWSKVEKLASVQKIQWIFNPPSAAWWGGWWERMIGLVKQILRKVLGNKVVDYDQLLTLITETEEILNNRPLTTLTEDPSDLIPLTPNMFVRNSAMNLIPELDVHDTANKRKIMKKLQQLRQALRSRFRREYLGFLRCQQSTNTPGQPLKPGDVVIVENDLQKRLDWPLGVIVEGYIGRGGVTRTYKVRTASGMFVRPAQRLFPVELSE